MLTNNQCLARVILTKLIPTKIAVQSDRYLRAQGLRAIVLRGETIILSGSETLQKSFGKRPYCYLKVIR